MPKPKPGEKESDYMSRCMSYPDLQDREQDQRVAICGSMFRQKNRSLIAVLNGDVEGHPFRGNQYTDEAGGGGGEPKDKWIGAGGASPRKAAGVVRSLKSEDFADSGFNAKHIAGGEIQIDDSGFYETARPEESVIKEWTDPKGTYAKFFREEHGVEFKHTGTQKLDKGSKGFTRKMKFTVHDVGGGKAQEPSPKKDDDADLARWQMEQANDREMRKAGARFNRSSLISVLNDAGVTSREPRVSLLDVLGNNERTAELSGSPTLSGYAEGISQKSKREEEEGDGAQGESEEKPAEKTIVKPGAPDPDAESQSAQERTDERDARETKNDGSWPAEPRSDDKEDQPDKGGNEEDEGEEGLDGEAEGDGAEAGGGEVTEETKRNAELSQQLKNTVFHPVDWALVNQGTRNGWVTRKGNAAGEADYKAKDAVAKAATQKAKNATVEEKDFDGYNSHGEAADAHRKAAKRARELGKEDEAQQHEDAAKDHDAQRMVHHKKFANSDRMYGPQPMLVVNRATSASGEVLENFALPKDGWVHVVPKGEYAHSETGLTQVLDDDSAKRIVTNFDDERKNKNFGGVRIDFDHFSYEPGQSSKAAGWIMALDNRGDGLWAKVEWSKSGIEAVEGGDYRFVSPVWRLSDCEPLENDRVRPTRLDSVGLTNNPNLRGMVPLSNASECGDSWISDDKECRIGAGALEMADDSAASLKKKYLQTLALQMKATPEERWKFGKELSALKKAHSVSKEAEKAVRKNRDLRGMVPLSNGGAPDGASLKNTRTKRRKN